MFEFLSLHDAELRSLATGRTERKLTLVFAKINGATVQFEFHDVFSFKVSSVLPQNVVSRVLLSSAGDIAADETTRIATWAFRGEEGNILIEDVKLEASVSRAMDNQLSLLYVAPSGRRDCRVVIQGNSYHRGDLGGRNHTC